MPPIVRWTIILCTTKKQKLLSIKVTQCFRGVKCGGKCAS